MREPSDCPMCRYFFKKYPLERIVGVGRKLLKSEDGARLWAGETAKLIQTLYHRDRFYFQGKSPKGTLAAALYVCAVKLGFATGRPGSLVTQRTLSSELNVTEAGIRDRVKGITGILPEYYNRGRGGLCFLVSRCAFTNYCQTCRLLLKTTVGFDNDRVRVCCQIEGWDDCPHKGEEGWP